MLVLDIPRPIASFILQLDSDITKPIKLSDERSYYRTLKRTKRISRNVDEVLFELDGDEIALIGATFGSIKNPSLIVYRMSCMSTIESNPMSMFIYICVKRDGLYYYPEDILQKMLLSKETVYYLQDYREHQKFVWSELLDVVDNVKQTFKEEKNLWMTLKFMR